MFYKPLLFPLQFQALGPFKGSLLAQLDHFIFYSLFPLDWHFVIHVKIGFLEEFIKRLP
jgi:hypothetical protein